MSLDRRPLFWSKPLGNVTLRTTDAAGRVTSITDPLGQPTSFEYDPLDHLTKIIDPLNGSNHPTLFGYDPNQNLTSVTDAATPPNATSYGYDAMNRRQSRTDALKKTENYQYDGYSDLIQFTDRKRTVTNYTYDAINRRISAVVTSPSADAIHYVWDHGDRLFQATDSTAGIVTRYNDLLDRLTAEVTPQGTVSYSYDNADRRCQMVVKPTGGSPVTYSYRYDDANRLTGIYQGGDCTTLGTLAVSFGYDNADRRTSLTLPNGVKQGYVYDRDSRVSELYYNHGSMLLGTLTYGYDADGRRIAVGGSYAGVVVPAAESGNGFNADNEMTGFNGNALSYDNDGQLLYDPVYGLIYAWDVRRHLQSVSGDTTVGYVYDALGRRIKKTLNGSTTNQYLYDGLNPVAELNGSGAVVASMLTGLNIDEYFVRTEPSCCGPLYYLTDALGSTIGLADSTGTAQVGYSYEPFGNSGPFSGCCVPTTNPYQFTGREKDFLNNSLYYYRGRYYSPTYQRFISQDPMGFAGDDTNVYTYVRNDPVDFIDPVGLGKIGAVIGGTIGAVAGAVGEGAEDAAAGTLAEPGVGTGVGAVVGAAIGATSGALTGAQVGSAIEDALLPPPPVRLQLFPRGVPPPGVYPPGYGRNECIQRAASRPRERTRGGQSLWDPKGGEWRYLPGDNYHNPHWDYNPWDRGPNTPWQNVPIGGLPVNK